MARQSNQRSDFLEEPSSRPVETTVVGALAEALAALGVEHAFGMPGDGIAVFVDALVESSIKVRFCQHETGAAFAAMEAHFASDRPAVVFSSAAPGILNILNGLAAARWEGARVILVSSVTNRALRGRWAMREASPYTLPQDAFYKPGALFDEAKQLENGAQVAEMVRRLTEGLRRPQGFVAHIGLPRDLQAHRIDWLAQHPSRRLTRRASASQVQQCAEVLQQGDAAIWVGFGARRAAPAIRALVERSGARVFCSPRAKGIVPETHPQFIGVTGIGGHEAVAESLVAERPTWTLVLGTRLGEPTSFWDPDLLPRHGFLHVDLDPDVPGTSYPEAQTVAIEAEIGGFLEDLLTELGPRPARKVVRPVVARWSAPEALPDRPTRSPVWPQALMAALQRRVVDGSDAIVLAECGNSFAWCNHLLRFVDGGRYRVSPRYGSMAHCTCGVVGAAMGRRGKAVAVTGDGSMLMGSELATAVRYDVEAVWVILNDSGYGMCRDGQGTLGLSDAELAVPRVDFSRMARAVGADGEQVTHEDDLDAALDRAMCSPKPFVLDVLIDTTQTSPLMQRFESLIRQGEAKGVMADDESERFDGF